MKKTVQSPLADCLEEVSTHMENFSKERELMQEIYLSFSAYIAFLENSLKQTENLIERCQLENKIKQAKKAQKNYLVLSPLAYEKMSSLEIDDAKPKVKRRSFSKK